MVLGLLLPVAHAIEWQQPPQELLDVMHAPWAPWSWSSPTGEHLLLAEPVLYPDLSTYAAGWHELAGMRVTPSGGQQGQLGAKNPQLVTVRDGTTIDLSLPEGARLHEVEWTVDGQRFALGVEQDDSLQLWVGGLDGTLSHLEGIELEGLLGSGFEWMPDQQHLLVRQAVRGPLPKAPSFPAGPAVTEGDGASARSTYEARNLLKTAYDEALFEHYTTSQLLLVDPKKDKRKPLGEPGIFSMAQPSPDGRYLLVERLQQPWSHEVAWWRFASEVEVWDKKGKRVSTVASLPLHDQVPIHGVPVGPREHRWDPTEPHTLHWIEALDGGDPVAEAEHRDRMMQIEAPFEGDAKEVHRAQHRVVSRRWLEDGTLVFTEWERMKRWNYTRFLDLDTGRVRPWFDRNEDDQYDSPGNPVYKALPNGQWVLRQQGDAVYFSGSGATPDGDRPFLDLRSTESGEVTRLFRSPADRYERFDAFVGDSGSFIVRSESATDVPNYLLATLGETVEAEAGEAQRTWTSEPITTFADPTPQLRQIEKRIVKYERNDGVPLSFQLYLPPGYEPGTKLPTVVYAYPLEYSDASVAGQVRGSTQRFDRFWGPTHLYFALQGYAVLHNTAMPMVGDPETVYDTFVPQLVADAEAAVAKAVELGIADPERIGVIGHSHGGLMVANLLAHTDLFKAGIARSGSYNKTMQPFGFQSERRSVFEARDVYIQVSPTFFADQVKEPVLVIHGNADSNPGTLTIQSEVFFEAVRGSGGTTRMVLLPYEDHGYRARQSVEHVLWEQLRWFDTYLKGSGEEKAP